LPLLEGRVRDAIDEAVLAAAQRGDGDAFAVIWRALAPSVAGYLAVRGVSDPDGVTSDVFLALFPRLPQLEGGVAGLRSFVFSVAHARLVDDARQRARRPSTVEFDTRYHDSVVASAEHEAMILVETARVHALLDRLSANHREVLALRVVADLDVEQTAKVMRRSVGSVKQLQRRALLALRAQLESADRVTGAARPAITDMT
jgi:RNA polymerase sigma-70 factor (ECF subfamily)